MKKLIAKVIVNTMGLIEATAVIFLLPILLLALIFEWAEQELARSKP